MPPPLGLSYRDLRLRIDGPDPALLDWLAEFLAPAFTVGAAEPADCRIEVVVDQDRLAAAWARVAADAAPLTCLVQDRELVRLPAGHDRSGVTIRDDAAGLAYEVSPDRRRLTLLTAARNRALRAALMKVVREVALSAAWTPGLVLHAAACAVGERALLIAGPKRAGKTSLLLHVLGSPGARLASNDRTVVVIDGTRLVAHGLPTIVTLRADTVARLFADDAARRAALRYHFALTIAEAQALPPAADPTPRALGCSPAQLAHLLGVERQGRADATALLLPRVDAAARGIALRRLDTATAVRCLADVLFAAHAAPQVSKAFALPDRAAVPASAALQARWQACVDRLRVFECRLGPDAYDRPATTLLDTVLGA